MASNQSLTPLSENDYEAIEAAVMETARGRWFLAEFAKRNRHADTSMLMEAIGKLEHSVAKEQGTFQVDRIRSDLMEMATTIAQLKIELASDNPDQNSFEQATEALDAVVQTTESATSNILEAAEEIQEIAWTLRESGAEIAVCDILDQRSADIYTACSFQDLTAQRTKKVVRTLRSIEGRINGLVDAWSAGDKSEGRDASVIINQGTVHNEFATYPASSRRVESRLSREDIELVMREDEGALIEQDAQPELPPLRLPGSQSRNQDIEIVYLPLDEVDHRPESNDQISPRQSPRTETVELSARKPSLSEIDAFSTSQKIEMFS